MHEKQEHKDVLGQTLQNARESRGIKAEDLAEMLDISVRHLSSVENNRGKLSYWKLYELIRLFGIDANIIFYPEYEIDNSRRQMLINMIKCCDEATADYLLKTLDTLNEFKHQILKK